MQNTGLNSKFTRQEESRIRWNRTWNKKPKSWEVETAWLIYLKKYIITKYLLKKTKVSFGQTILIREWTQRSKELKTEDLRKCLLIVITSTKDMFAYSDVITWQYRKKSQISNSNNSGMGWRIFMNWIFLYNSKHPHFYFRNKIL